MGRWSPAAGKNKKERLKKKEKKKKNPERHSQEQKEERKTDREKPEHEAYLARKAVIFTGTFMAWWQDHFGIQKQSSVMSQNGFTQGEEAAVGTDDKNGQE